MKRPVVADAGPIIHLAELDRLDLVDAFENVHVTRTVLDEVDAGGRPDALETLDYTTHDVSVDSGKAGDLDAGERTAIALCKLPHTTSLGVEGPARSLRVGLSHGLPFYAPTEAGGRYSPLTFSVPRFKRTSTGAPPSSAFCRRRRYCKPMFFDAL